MTNELYEAGWDTIAPIMDEYFSLSGRFVVPHPPTQKDYNRVHAEYISIRDATLLSIGITFEELENENDLRLDEKYNGK